MLYSNLNVNNEGHLTFAGIDTTELAKEYGTPLMAVDESVIRFKAKTYVDSLKKYFGEGSFPLFASKAFCFKEIYRIMKSEGVSADVVSDGELYTALKSGFDPKNIFFHGNNKTLSEIEFAIDSNIGYFVVDNLYELENVNAIAEEKGKLQNILIRLTPGIDPHTLEAISTGKVDSKFGLPIETGQAREGVKKALSLKNIRLCGFHCHVGSQVFDIKAFDDAAAIMLKFMKDMKDEFGFYPEYLDLGGGFGVRYVESDPELDLEKCIKDLSVVIKNYCSELNVDVPNIILEPGRSMVADSCITLYTVGNIKVIPGYKNYVAVDGGMTDNPRYALYGSSYTVLLANKMNETKDFTCSIAGKCCESGDLLQENVVIPTPEHNDILAVLTTGAYNYSMASNYNRVARPAVVMIKDKTPRVVIKRESLEDMTKNEI